MIFSNLTASSPSNTGVSFIGRAIWEPHSKTTQNILCFISLQNKLYTNWAKRVNLHRIVQLSDLTRKPRLPYSPAPSAPRISHIQGAFVSGGRKKAFPLQAYNIHESWNKWYWPFPITQTPLFPILSGLDKSAALKTSRGCTMVEAKDPMETELVELTLFFWSRQRTRNSSRSWLA